MLWASMVGQSIAKFGLGKRLGEGRLGEVFEAVNRETGGKAAIKVFHQEPSRRHEIQGFFDHVRSLRPISHAGMAKIIDFGLREGDGRAYVITELLGGESLGSRLQRGRFSTTQTADVVQQIARTLMVAQGVGVVHHALKPSNIFFTPDPDRASQERIIVVDFGLARLVGAKLEYGHPQYLAPEQWMGAAQDGSADIYALGVMAFEMMTGRPPFTSPNHVQAREKHLRDNAPAVRSYVPDAGAVIDRLIGRMLEKKPQDRPKSLRDLAKLFDLLVGLEAPLGETTHD
jgi:eukaryotic-like serine/threonine-protein kinase